jgi:hypothetical protein
MPGFCSGRRDPCGPYALGFTLFGSMSGLTMLHFVRYKPVYQFGERGRKRSVKRMSCETRRIG